MIFLAKTVSVTPAKLQRSDQNYGSNLVINSRIKSETLPSVVTNQLVDKMLGNHFSLFFIYKETDFFVCMYYVGTTSSPPLLVK